jgi:hypothetical protein
MKELGKFPSCIARKTDFSFGTAVAPALDPKEGRTMAGNILVPLKRHDRIEDIFPYIEQVTHPGMRVVFLVQHPVSGFKWLQAYCGIAQCGLEKPLAVKRMIESYSLETRVQLAQRRVFQICEALHDMRLNITVNVYTSSLRRTLKGYANNGGSAAFCHAAWSRAADY